MRASAKRKLLLTAAIGLGGLLLILLAMPLWFPWLLQPVAAQYGLSYAGYKREGYQRFRLTDVVYTNSAVTLHAGGIEGFVPTAHLWHQYITGAPATFLKVADWTLQIHRRGAATPSAPAGVYEQFERFRSDFERLETWEPRGALTNGAIEELGTRFLVSTANWATGAVSLQVAYPRYQQNVTLHGHLGGQPPYQVRLDSSSLDFQATVWINQNVSSLRFQTAGQWQKNPFHGQAEFTPGRIYPNTAFLQAKGFTLPAEAAGLNTFQDFSGNLLFRWQTNQYAIDLDGAARPLASWQLTPVSVALHALGNTKSAVIEKARIALPWLFAELKEGTRIQFASPFLTAPTTLRLGVDLTRQPWIPANGKLEGEAVFRPGPTQYPAASFTLAGQGIQVSNISSKALQVQGELNWPELELPRVTVELADGSRGTAQGKLNLATRVVQHAHLELNGRFGQQWLPAGYSYGGLALVAELSGPFQKLLHSGRLTLSHFAAPGFNPMQISAQWNGEQLNLNLPRLEATAGSSTLMGAGAAHLGGPQKSLRLTTLTLTQAGQPMWELQQPFTALLKPAVSSAWSLSLEPFRWAGRAGEIQSAAQLAWPHSGQVDISAQRVDLTSIQDFLQMPQRQMHLEHLGLSATWSNSPIRFNLEFNASTQATNEPLIAAQGTLQGDGRGVTIQGLSISTRAQPAMLARGYLPLTLQPVEPFVQLRPEPLQLQAKAQPNAYFWKEFARRTGVVLQDPQVQLEVGGNWGAPHGRIEVHVPKVQFANLKQPLPPLDDLHVTAVVEQELARVQSLTLSIAKQPVSLQGQIPLGEKFWRSVPNQVNVPDWHTATAHLKINRAQLAAFSQVLPQIAKLSREGILDVDLELLPGGKFSGQAFLDGVSMEPIGTFGPVRNIEMLAKFNEQTVQLEGVGLLGGQLLRATGKADLQDEQWLQGSLPPFQLHLQGTNLTLSQQLEFVLRADLDLFVRNPGGQPITIAGGVTLQKSLFLQDLNNLVGGKVATPARRPPYFSISTEPFAQWRLDVKVIGEHFLKVQTPVFAGEVSAHFKLQGTLKDPIALGELTIDKGNVRFPFASLPVTQGRVTLTSGEPYNPQLFIMASAQTFGYEVKMQVTGPANNPVLQFTSTPALSSEQVLLMLSTGELPRGSFTLSTQQRAQTFAMFLGRGLLSQLGFGAGAADRLTIQSGENLTVTGRPTYSIEYRMTQDWSIIGQYDRFNDYNLMLKWRVYQH